MSSQFLWSVCIYMYLLMYILFWYQYIDNLFLSLSPPSPLLTIYLMKVVLASLIILLNLES